MTTYVYDGSFEGLLSVVFDIFANKIFPNDIVEESRCQLGLLDETRSVCTHEDQAERVLRALDRKSEGRGSLLVYKMFLSGLPEMEMAIFRLIKTLVDSSKSVPDRQLNVLDSPLNVLGNSLNVLNSPLNVLGNSLNVLGNSLNVLGNYANPHVAHALRIEKMIGREVHRMHAFVRFQKSANGIFRALINPDFNVLPLIGTHFEKRYADQPWIILDSLRHYALYYDLTTARFIGPDHPLLLQHLKGQENNWRDEKEDLYQQLWVSYFNSVNIQERKNTKLHLRHMPRRYWRFLIEKSHPTRPPEKGAARC